MGWKNIKTHYGIKHIVQVTKEGICIGSGYIGSLMAIDKEGRLTKRYVPGFSLNKDLLRYQAEMDADPELLRKLVMSPDTFDKSVTVYTYRNDEIIEQQCEEPGYPNVTHDGQLMYDNTHSTEKAQVVKWAKANARAGIRQCQRALEETERQLLEDKNRLARNEAELAKLQADFPEND